VLCAPLAQLNHNLHRCLARDRPWVNISGADQDAAATKRQTKPKKPGRTKPTKPNQSSDKTSKTKQTERDKQLGQQIVWMSIWIPMRTTGPGAIRERVEILPIGKFERKLNP